MKYPLLKVFKSSKGDMEHYIFRTENKDLELTLDQLINHEKPVGLIKEGLDATIDKEVKNMTMALNQYPIGYEGWNALTLPFDFNVSNVDYTLDIKNSGNATDINTYRIYLGGTVISKIEIVKNGVTIPYTDPTWINEKFKVLGSNSILINKTLSNYNTVTFTGFVKVYQFIDTGGTLYDGECVPSPANGIYVPTISTIEASDYISFYQEVSTRKKAYYYVVIAKDSTGNISELSNTQVAEIIEDPTAMEFILESSDDFYSNPIPTWKVVDTKNPSEEIRVTTKSNNLASSVINVLKYFDIYCNDDDLRLEGIRILKIKNLWNIDNRKLMSRPKKVFRAKNKMSLTESYYCKNIKFTGTVEVLIDKMMILKKDVTLLDAIDQSTPIAITDVKADTLKVFVRQGGMYYKDFFLNNFETNKNDEYYRYDENFEKILIPENVVSSITLDSRFPILNIKDGCIYGNKYNYTIYLYDETGAVSKPVSIVL